MAIEMRGARPEEMPAVLDMVPRVMGATRQYFAAMYRNDPWAEPEQSRIVRLDGKIVSHLRLYDRWQRVGPVPVRVGGVGDVCTLPEYRKRGYCRALLEDALQYWEEREYDLSMIVSGVGVYAACGWAPLAEAGLEIPVQPGDAGRALPAPGAYEVRRFVRSEDLRAVAGVYAAYNAERSLTTVRTAAYWERHFSWISGEIEEAFLVAEREGQIVAYSRCEGWGTRLTVSENCFLLGHDGAAVELLDATRAFAAKRRVESLQGHFPVDHPVRAAALQRTGATESETSGLLFRLVSLARLLTRLQPLLEGRVRMAGVAGSLTLEVDGQAVKLRARLGRLEIDAPEADRVCLPPALFFCLLFGAEEPAGALAGLPAPARRVLTALFPRGAPVYWRTDVV